MNTSPEAVVAAFVTLGWILTGTLTYWLICDADDEATDEATERHCVRHLYGQRTDDS